MARQVSRAASVEGRLSTCATTSPSGPGHRDHPALHLGPRRRQLPHRGHRQVVEAEQAELSPGRVLGRLRRDRHAGPAAQPGEGDLATLVCRDDLGAVAGYLAVVEAVRQHEHVGGEPVAAEMAALPDVCRAGRRERPRERPAAQRAAGVVATVRAHEVRRAGGGLADGAVPRGGQQVGVGGAGRPPQALPARAAVGVGPPPAGVGEPVTRTADQQQPHVLGARPLGQQRRNLGVEAGLRQRLATPRAGLLDQHPALGRRRGRHRGVAAGQGPHRAAAVVEAPERTGRDVRTHSPHRVRERLIGRSRMHRHGFHRARRPGCARRAAPRRERWRSTR